MYQLLRNAMLLSMFIILSVISYERYLQVPLPIPKPMLLHYEGWRRDIIHFQTEEWQTLSVWTCTADTGCERIQ